MAFSSTSGPAQNSIGSKRGKPLHQILDNKAEALEFAVHETCGVPPIFRLQS
ncbi:MAG: hypothetical protein ACLR2E_03190 [Lachnospiraceae bacterium]